MKKLLGLVLIGSLMAGCGGASSLLGAVTGNPYDGTYSGGSISDNVRKVSNMTIVNGAMSGTVTDSSNNTTVAMTATVANDGTVTGGLMPFTTAITFGGNLTINGNSLTGSLQEAGGATGTLKVSMTRN